MKGLEAEERKSDGVRQALKGQPLDHPMPMLNTRVPMQPIFLLLATVLTLPVRSADPPIEAPRPTAHKPATIAPTSESPKSVEELTALVRKSVVVVSFEGRDGRQAGLGSGFVIAPDGLIATNLHVIGEARPIAVQTEDGRSYNVTAIHATDRAADLAIIRIDAAELPALELGDSDTLRQGQSIVALGNPRPRADRSVRPGRTAHARRCGVPGRAQYRPPLR